MTDTGTTTQKHTLALPRLFHKAEQLERCLLKKIYGQDEAVHSVIEGYFDAEVMMRTEQDRTAPRAAFLFTGPRGVGKSYLAEQVAVALDLPFKRFKMSGLGDDLQYRSLVGASSHRYPTEGALTSFVRANPKSVVLFDGVERMHFETLEMVHEILRTGVLRDDYLETEASFLDVIIIFSSSEAYSPRAESISAHTVTFYDLKPQDLEKIIQDELWHCCELFETQYGVQTEVDEHLATALLASLRVFAGTKKLRKSVYTFFKTELFALRELFTNKDADELAKRLTRMKLVFAGAESAREKDATREIEITDDRTTITIRLTEPRLKND